MDPSFARGSFAEKGKQGLVFSKNVIKRGLRDAANGPKCGYVTESLPAGWSCDHRGEILDL